VFTQMGFCGWRWVSYPIGMDDSPTSTQWMARAAEARSLATRMRDPDSRSTMLSIAAGYERLARRAEVTKAEAPVVPTDIYRSSNGDRWRLVTNSSGRRLVRHEPNPASGGQATETPVEDFLAVNGPGPEYGALRRMLASGERSAEVDC
jgi:hypothetical protein